MRDKARTESSNVVEPIPDDMRAMCKRSLIKVHGQSLETTSASPELQDRPARMLLGL
jgi:hypothetical protein